MKVKICGVTNLDDALYIAEFGADAIGFVFYKNSPRYISYEECAKIIEKLPPFITKVGLFVEATSKEIEIGAKISKIDIAQIHFDVTQDFIDTIDFKSLPVIRANKKSDIERFNSFRLVDAYSNSYGGSGKRLNLDWFNNIDCSNIIIAGGLTPYNLNELKGYGFYGVDVSSGVEAYKGKKDLQKVKEFIKNAKAIWTTNNTFQKK